MIPVDQRTRGGAGAPPAERGDCLSACLASVLELPLGDVPRFCEIEDPDAWGPAIDDWLAPMGLYFVEVGWSEWFAAEVLPRAGWHLVAGLSPRGHRHSVVGYAGRLVHDPHPDVAGEPKLEPPGEGDRQWTIGFLVPRDPVVTASRARLSGRA